VRVSVGLPIHHDTTAAEIIGWSQAVERAGLHAVFVTDHPAPTSVWLRRGGHHTLDPFVALSFAAANTTSLGLHFNLLVAAYRHPLVTAKAIASLDSLSGGRVIVGVGVGYLEAEFAALGAEYEQRTAVTDANLAAMITAWTGEPFGEHGTIVLPRPVQVPHPPIWIGGNSRAARRRAVAIGQGWAPMPSSAATQSLLGTPPLDDVDELARRIIELHQLSADSGRTDRLDVAVIPRSLSGFAAGEVGAEQIRDEIGRLVDAGGTVLVANLPAAGFTEAVQWLAEEVAVDI
jgi:probable F420-dependent oxidoreductase